MTEPKVDLPDFMVVLRGYDRRQVEVWANEVAAQIEQERQRADEAEKVLYRMQMEKGAPSFTGLGSHVAGIIEEAGRSAENMLVDAADRAQEAIDAAEEEAAEIIKAAEHRAGEIEQAARHAADEHRAEGERIEEEARQAAESMRAQAEQDARTVLEEARDATDLIWQEAERERVAVEAEAIRLETLRHRSLEQLGRMYGHLESVLDEVRAGIGRVDADHDDEPEATAALPAARPEATAAPPAARPEAATGPDGPASAPAEAAKPTPAGGDQPAPAQAAAETTTQQPAQAADGGAEAGPGPDGDHESRDDDTTQGLEQAAAKEQPAGQGAGSAKEASDRA
jgi:cell division septum initiation protein DivIVA